MTPSNTVKEIGQVKPMPSKTYKLDLLNKRILSVGTADGLSAIHDSSIKRMETERYVYPIYNSEYGTDIEQYKSKPYEYIYTDLYREVSESQLTDDRVTSITNYAGSRTGEDSATFEMTINTKAGEFLYTKEVLV